MSELRWHPLRREWVVTAAHRQGRPLLRADGCPFCPSSGLVPAEYDVHLYKNDFPTFSLPPPTAAVTGTGLYCVQPAAGVCDVVLYHPDHDATFAGLPLDHIRKIIRLWVERFCELGAMPEIAYVFVFENKGEVIGVTMSHPHGQIYGFPFIPPVIENELQASEAHWREKKTCLVCDILAAEKQDGRRIILENDSYTAFIPFFARLPYEVHIVPKRHFGNFFEITASEIDDLAPVLKTILLKYDGLFGLPMPYMLIQHQTPTDGKDYPYYHFHIELYPPLRAADKLKYLASSESGAGTFINDTLAEEKAAELREVRVD